MHIALPLHLNGSKFKLAASALLVITTVGGLAREGMVSAQGVPPGQLKVGPVVTMAIDNNGSGWAWTGPASPSDNGHLVRMENGAWRDIPRTDPAGASLLNTSPAIYGMALTGKGNEGWAIGNERGTGAPALWHYTGGSWQRYRVSLPTTTLFDEITLDADGTDGWIVTQDRNLNYSLLRLRNGQWTPAPTPSNIDVQTVAISADGHSTWANGQLKDTKGFVGLFAYDGKWDTRPSQLYDVPYNAGDITADNFSNGWTIGPPINSRLIRLGRNNAVEVSPDITLGGIKLTPQEVLEQFVINTLRTDGLGRGWITGTARQLKGQGAGQIQPVLLRVRGDEITQVPIPGVQAVPANQEPPYLGPIAISPDGAHSWLAVSTGDSKFGGLLQLKEPWPHDSPPAVSPLPGAGHCFQQVPYCLRGVFASYWEQKGGLDLFGYPITLEVQETIGGRTYTVQYTQRARFEYHPENKAPYNVLLGLLGNALVEDRLSEDPFQPKPPSIVPSDEWFQQTQHNVRPPFLEYWKNNGGLPVYGLPRSEAFQEKNAADGKVYLVQYFERNRIEYHPENQGTRFEFLLGLLGTEQFNKTYGYIP